MLACACEKLSARRFAEYLSLAQVPQLDGRPRESGVHRLRTTSCLVRPPSAAATATDRADRAAASTSPSVADRRIDDDAVVDGSLRAPWKWETLIVESAVIGGDPARWHRRLAGLAREYRLKIQRGAREDPESPRARGSSATAQPGAPAAFALPIIDVLASWPATATWGEWLDRFAELAPLVLRQPERVLRVIAELRPMAASVRCRSTRRATCSPTAAHARAASRRAHRYGRVFVGGPQQARGRTFRVVFVAGLAERMFPQKPHEDPMLLDARCASPLGAGLRRPGGSRPTERLLLRLAVGAPTERLWLSYPRIEIAESRPRVPSFYALDVMRAITGRDSRPRGAAGARRDRGRRRCWRGRRRRSPRRAIDDLEHDLAVLRDAARRRRARRRSAATRTTCCG